MDSKTTGSTPSQDERKFLHDISSPLGTALFLVDSVVETCQAQPISQEELDLLKNALTALIKAKNLIQDRRQVLIQSAASGAGSSS